MKTENTVPESQLLALLAKGNVAAFKQLYHGYSASVYHAAFRVLRCEERTQDLVQEVFTRVWHKRHNFKDIENIRAYLVVMSKNLALRYMLQMAREAEAGKTWGLEHPTEAHHTEQQVDKQELEGLLREAINLLPAQQKQVYQLARLQGLSYEDIGERMQISANTVKVHLVQANSFIRQRLKPLATGAVSTVVAILSAWI